MKKSIRRRQLYINRSFQARFIAKFMSIVLVGGVISICLTLLNNQGTLTSSYVDSRLVIQNTSHAIMTSVIFTNLATTAALAVVSVLVTLLVSHKIAGPMYRFEKDIDRVAKGDLRSRISIREGDQFQELVVSLNAMIENLNTGVSSIRGDVAALAREEDLPEELRRKIDLLNEKIDASFML